MLSDHEQAEAYAFLLDGIEELSALLNVIEGGLLEEDWQITKRLGMKLQGVREILEP